MLPYQRIVQPIRQQWRRHSLWRLSFLIAVMLWLTVALALLTVYQFSIQPMVRSQHQLIAQHIEHLQTATEISSDVNFEQWLEDTLYDNENLITVIKTPDGQVYGSLSDIPSHLPTCPSIAPFAIVRGTSGSISTLEGCAIIIDEHKVLIATDNEYLRQMQDNFISAALTIMVLCFFIALIPGWIVKRKISQQLDAINQVVNNIEQGYFDSRIPLEHCPTEHDRDEWERIALFINRMLDEVEASIDQIQGVTDAIAHDLRTPLTRIKNRITEIEGEENPRVRAQYLNHLHAEFDDILTTFNAMLELSKLQAMRDTSNFTQINAALIMQDVTELIEPLLEDKHQTLSQDIQPFELLGERSLLFRMMYNLIDNAHKYSPEGAHISIQTNAQRIVIEDNGPGIAPELHSRVFQRLYRLDASRNTPGHGIGLALVAAVTKLHNLEIILTYSDTANQTGLKTIIQPKKHLP
ncbi:HAMP domain-containing sensor histidine kinase [Vibrio sp. FNV 38]|nr:HAMP domain-containing sensor histidine kinase [Vibrio sp. FNV 38]